MQNYLIKTGTIFLHDYKKAMKKQFSITSTNDYENKMTNARKVKL